MKIIKKALTNNLFNQSFFMLFTNAYGKLISLVSNLIIANLFGAEIYGDYVYLLAILSTITIFPVFGLDRGIINYIPKLQGSGRNREAKSLSLFSILYTGVLGFLISISIFLFAEEISLNILNNLSYSGLLKYFSFFIFLSSLHKVILSIFQSYSDFKIFTIGLNFMEPTIFFIVIIFLGSIIEHNIDYIPILGRHIALIVTIFFLILFLHKKDYLRNFNIRYFKAYKELLVFSFPLLFVSAIGVLMAKIDIIMVGQFLTSRDVAVYNAAAQFAVIGSFLLNSVNQVYMPKLSKNYSEGNVSLIKKDYGQITAILLFISLMMLTVIYIFRNSLLGLYGDEFINGSSVLILLVIGQLINAVAGPCGSLIVIMVSPKYDLLINVLLIILNIIMNIILIPLYGINGAAVGTLVSFAIANFLKVFILYKKFEIVPFKLKFKS